MAIGCRLSAVGQADFRNNLRLLGRLSEAVNCVIATEIPLTDN